MTKKAYGEPIKRFWMAGRTDRYNILCMSASLNYGPVTIVNLPRTLILFLLELLYQFYNWIKWVDLITYKWGIAPIQCSGDLSRTGFLSAKVCKATALYTYYISAADSLAAPHACHSNIWLRSVRIRTKTAKQDEVGTADRKKRVITSIW